MGRTRRGTVAETIEELQELERRYAGTQYETRVRFLLALKLDPRAKSEELVDALGLSDRTTRRWWKDYLQGGIVRFLDQRVLQPTASEPASAYDYDDARELMDFLNGLPLTNEYAQWKLGVEQALAEYLKGIGRVEVTVFGLEASASEHKHADDSPTRTVDISVGAEEPLGRLRLHLNGSDSFDPALEQIDELGQFIEFLFTDIAARCPSLAITSDSTDPSFLTPPLMQALTPRERDILVHRLSGYSYADTASLLKISEETVRKCVKSIYRKTGTSTLGELFVRYFAAMGNSADVREEHG